MIFVVIMSVFFYDEFLFEKEKLKVKNYFKKFSNILKPILIFLAVFIITFIILLVAVFIKTYAAEPDTTQAVDELTTETETVSISDEELSSINDEIESLLNDISTGDVEDDESAVDEDFLLNESESEDDNDVDKDKSDKTIIIYQIPAQTQTVTEAEIETQTTIYNSIEEYEENESFALTYFQILFLKLMRDLSIMIAFILGLLFIIMVAVWRGRM